MSRLHRARAPFIRFAILLGLLVFAPGAVFAQGASGELPEHARAKSFGSGWECNPGYRKTEGACIAIKVAAVSAKVPANSYPTDATYGRGWECSWGYRPTRNACVVIEVPAHGYLNSSGGRWECDRGYREAGDACVAIEIPANGYLTEASYGSGWRCDRGYRVADETCAPVTVPQNAHLNFSGNDWDCNRPYRKQKGGCVRR